jgi:hypothetical protein
MSSSSSVPGSFSNQPAAQEDHQAARGRWRLTAEGALEAAGRGSWRDVLGCCFLFSGMVAKTEVADDRDCRRRAVEGLELQAARSRGGGGAYRPLGPESALRWRQVVYSDRPSWEAQLGETTQRPTSSIQLMRVPDVH